MMIKPIDVNQPFESTHIHLNRKPQAPANIVVVIEMIHNTSNETRSNQTKHIIK